MAPQIALIVVNPEAGFTTPMLKQLVDLGYAVHGVADAMLPGEVHSYGWVVDGPTPIQPSIGAPVFAEAAPAAAEAMPPLTHENPFGDPLPAPPPISAVPLPPVPTVDPSLPAGLFAVLHDGPWTTAERIKYLLPDEGAIVGKLRGLPESVVQDYKDGKLIGLLRAEYPPDLMTKAKTAWAAVVNGKRTLPQAQAWFAGEAAKYVQPAQPATQSGLPGVDDGEQALIDQLNKHKYVRQIVGDLIERGFSDRASVTKFCESVKDKVPLLALQGLNLKSRIDQSFAAIGQ